MKQRRQGVYTASVFFCLFRVGPQMMQRKEQMR